MSSIAANTGSRTAVVGCDRLCVATAFSLHSIGLSCEDGLQLCTNWEQQALRRSLALQRLEVAAKLAPQSRVVGSHCAVGRSGGSDASSALDHGLGQLEVTVARVARDLPARQRQQLRVSLAERAVGLKSSARQRQRQQSERCWACCGAHMRQRAACN